MLYLEKNTDSMITVKKLQRPTKYNVNIQQHLLYIEQRYILNIK